MNLIRDLEKAATIIITLLLTIGREDTLEIDKDGLYEFMEGEEDRVYEWVLMLLDGAKRSEGAILYYIESQGIAIRWNAKIAIE